MIQSLIFFPDKDYYDAPSQYGLSYEVVTLETSSGARLVSWFFQAKQAKGTILFFHGNAGNISGRIHKAFGWVQRGYSVFLLDYRGYGQSTGSLESDEDTVEDGKRAFDWLCGQKNTQARDMIFFGESLGCFPAVRLAGEHECRAVILEAPYTSFVDLAPIHYPMIPSWIREPLMKKFRFSVMEAVRNLKAPLFIIHGTEDETCPYGLSQKLYDSVPGIKKFFSVSQGTHNDLPERAGESYWDEPQKFIETLPLK